MGIVLILCLCVYGALGQGTGMPGPQPGFTPTGGFGPPFPGPTGPGGVSAIGPVFGPMGPLRPLSAPMSPMAMMMASLAQNPNNYRYATCNFNDTWSAVRGRVDMRQFLIGEGQQQVQIRIQVSGLPQSVMEVDRGIHVHEFGDIGDGCARVGPHFNPNQTPHGSRRNFAYLRHVGDLGNIRQSSSGLVSTQFVDQVISLEGSNNVIGRAFVIKLERDDEGLGTSRESRVNGNTHIPLACCTIGRTIARNWYNPMSATDLQNMAVTGMMPDNTIDPFNANTFNNNGGFPGSGMNTGGGNPGFTGGFNTGMPGSTQFGGPGTMTQPGFGSQPGFGGPTGMTQSGFGGTGSTGFGTGGFGPQPGQTGPPMFGGSGPMGQSSFGMQPGFGGPTGFGMTQPGFGGTGSSTSFGTGPGLTQPGFGTGGLTQTGFGPQTGPGLTHPGFGGTGSGSGTQSFGAGTFTPGSAPGQTFNFANQGRK